LKNICSECLSAEEEEYNQSVKKHREKILEWEMKVEKIKRMQSTPHMYNNYKNGFNIEESHHSHFSSILPPRPSPPSDIPSLTSRLVFSPPLHASSHNTYSFSSMGGMALVGDSFNRVRVNGFDSRRAVIPFFNVCPKGTSSVWEEMYFSPSSNAASSLGS
jgi:hypothetical protein